ncbi:LysR substrate-binding domain-containing protein [Gordonia sp. VNQ95]|uniref:LysR substrate-binding domain-containing protein n=1 Tax=Gordonia sp. VNQ95 TaxID=3156619 RepID=UPI0032B535D4
MPDGNGNDMEIRQLQALIAVADTGSVTAAAKVLHIVQPAVTKQIQTLESELGVELFSRSRAGMTINPNGQQVLDRARRVLRELDRARDDVRSGDSSELRGQVTIGLLPSTALLLAPRLVAAAADRYPGIRLRISVGYAGHLATWLDAGDVDVALLFEQPSTAMFRIDPILREELWAVAPSSAHLRSDDPIALKDVLSQPLILPAPPHGLRSIIETVAAETGLTITIPVETNDSAIQRRLVADGYGWTVLPPTMVTPETAPHDDISTAPIVGAPLMRTIGTALARQPDSSRAGAAINALLRETVTTAATSGAWPSAHLL